MACSGRPLCITEYPKTSGFLLRPYSNSSPVLSVDVYSGDELLYLKCERMFAKDQNFSFRKFTASAWENTISSETGILEIYFELDKSTNILDMYVLASGGNNDSKNTQKPSAWPSEYWKTDYAGYTVYMSRASWKLSNIKFDKTLPNHGWN